MQMMMQMILDADDDANDDANDADDDANATAKPSVIQYFAVVKSAPDFRSISSFHGDVKSWQHQISTNFKFCSLVLCDVLSQYLPS